MSAFLINHLTEILSFLGGIFAGSFFTYTVTRNNRVSGKSRLVDQSGARAGGDMVGGNKTTNKH